MGIHNKINDEQIRKSNEKFNKEFIKSLNLSFNIDHFEGKLDKGECNDSTVYQLVWLKNIDRLINLIPKEINIENYNLCDVGCGLCISTIYFQKNYVFKSFSGFDYNQELIFTSKKIINELDLNNKISVEIDNALNIKLKSKPYILFLFNPFGSQTLNLFLNNNLENLKSNKSIILYANDLWKDSINGFKKVYRDDFYNLSTILF